MRVTVLKVAKVVTVVTTKTVLTKVFGKSCGDNNDVRGNLLRTILSSFWIFVCKNMSYKALVTLLFIVITVRGETKCIAT